MTSRSVNNSQNDNRHSPTSSQPPTTKQASFRDWIGVIAASLAAFMAIFALQSTIPAINNMSGDLGVPLQFGAWVLYGYLVALIISIPVAGFFSKVFSVRRYFLVCICLFLVASIAYSLVTTFSLMIMVKGIQGFTAGGLTAIATVIIVTELPPAKRPIGLTLTDCVG